MGYKTAYKEVMRSYETSRDQADALLVQRRTAVYKSTPRLAEIDQELTALGLSTVKMALAGSNQDNANQNRLAQNRANAAALEQEKRQLLAQNGIPEDYLTTAYRCTICQDTGHLPTQPGQPAQRCSCLKQRLIEAYYSLSNVKGILEEENFDTFDHRCFSPATIESEGLSQLVNMQAIYRMSTEFVQDFDSTFNNLLLYGPTGLGKTFVCHCIAKDLLDTGHTVLYLTAPRLFKIIEDYRFNRDALAEPDEMIDAVTDVDLLILDDLGAEFITVITTSALFNIVNERLLMKKPTVISTNLSPMELERHYSERIVSRFAGHYQMIKFFGEDVRVKKKYGGR